MGYEYLIAGDPHVKSGWAEFLERLDNPVDSGGWQAFTTEATDQGVYFCDHGRSAEAALAFRRIVDHALAKCESVTVREC